LRSNLGAAEPLRPCKLIKLRKLLLVAHRFALEFNAASYSTWPGAHCHTCQEDKCG
jgi:hypothetical protein